MVKQETVTGFQALESALSKTAERVFILFTGSKIKETGQSWCPDCVVAEPVIEKVLKKDDIGLDNATFIT